MTNSEKYLKDGVDIEELATKIIEYGVFGDTATWKQAIIEFMNKSAKPTLTEDEQVILRNIQLYTGHTITIRRARDSHLYISGGCGLIDFGEYNHLFQFIQPRRRI